VVVPLITYADIVAVTVVLFTYIQHDETFALLLDAPYCGDIPIAAVVIAVADAVSGHFASLPEKDQQNEQNIQKYKADIENLANAQQAFNMQVSSTVAKLDSDIFKRNTKNAIEHQGAIKALSKAYEDYLVAEGKVAEQRNKENVLREQLRWATPEQAAYIQAVAKETDRLTQAQQKLADAVREANKEFKEASKNGPNPAAQKLAYEKLLAAQSA
jgi:hypothetical protein